MTEPRAIQATYVDLKFIKTRKCAQMILEVPIEQGDEVVRMFGTPKPDKEVWVAVARLDKETATVEGGDPHRTASRVGLDMTDGGGAEAAPAKPKRDWYDMQPSQRAGILCNEVGFQDWIADCERNRGTGIHGVEMARTHPVEWLRAETEVLSRRHFNPDNVNFNAAALARFEVIETAYRIHAGLEAEGR